MSMLSVEIALMTELNKDVLFGAQVFKRSLVTLHRFSALQPSGCCCVERLVQRMLFLANIKARFSGPHPPIVLEWNIPAVRTTLLLSLSSTFESVQKVPGNRAAGLSPFNFAAADWDAWSCWDACVTRNEWSCFTFRRCHLFAKVCWLKNLGTFKQELCWGLLTLSDHKHTHTHIYIYYRFYHFYFKWLIHHCK